MANNEEFGAYLAGVIDARGTVTVSGRDDALRMYPVILVSHGDKDLLEYIKEIVGSGSIYPHGKGWTYRAEGLEPCKEILHLTKGKLRHKKENATLLRRFMRLHENSSIPTWRKRAEKQHIADQIIELQGK